MSSSSSIISYDKPESCCCDGIPETIHCYILKWEPDPSGSFPDAIQAEHSLDLSMCYNESGNCSGLAGPFPPICGGSTWVGSFSYNEYEFNGTGYVISIKSSTAILICASYCSSFFIGGSQIGGETVVTTCPPRVNEIESDYTSGGIYIYMRCYW